MASGEPRPDSGHASAAERGFARAAISGRRFAGQFRVGRPARPGICQDVERRAAGQADPGPLHGFSRLGGRAADHGGNGRPGGRLPAGAQPAAQQRGLTLQPSEAVRSRGRIDFGSQTFGLQLAGQGPAARQRAILLQGFLPLSLGLVRAGPLQLGRARQLAVGPLR